MGMHLRWLGALVLALPPLADASPAAFTEGVHEALAERVYDSQNAEYGRVMAEFDAHLKRHPQDSVAAVERCRFIDRFAYSEESENEQAIADSETCHAALTQEPMASSVAAKLFLWENDWEEDGIAKGEALLADSKSWNRRQLARLHEMLANRYRNRDALKAGEHALIAVDLDADPGMRLLAANHLVRIGARARALTMIQGMPAAQWHAWNLRSAVETLLDMGETRAAADLLRQRDDLTVDASIRARLARALLTAGDAERARSMMNAIAGEPVVKIGGETLDREVFEFQRDHGSQADAIAAYRKLRDHGYKADPFGRARLSLFLRHPGAPWQADEWLGVGGLALLLAGMIVMPLLVVAPLHYWSLYRRVHAPVQDTLEPPWNFGHLWYGLAVILSSGVIGLYLFSYVQLENLFFATHIQSRIADERDLGHAFLFGEALALLGVLPLVARAGLKARLIGQWPIGQSIAAGVGLSFGLLMAAGIVKVISKPGVALGGDTIRALQGIHALYGTLGLLFAAAVLAPLVEELVFRGVFLQVAARHARFWLAAVLQAGIFVALHDQASAAPFLFALALVAAWLALRSGGLVAPIALHVTNNTMACLAVMGVTRSVSVVP